MKAVPALVLFRLLCSLYSVGGTRVRVHADVSDIADILTPPAPPIVHRSDQLYLTRRFTTPQELAAAATHLRNRLNRVGQQPRVYAAPAGKDRPRRGIVIPAGGRKLFANAFIVVKVIREHFHCQLPVDIMYFSPDEVDETVAMALKAYPDVTLRDTRDQPNFPKFHYMPQETAGYVKKIFALYFTGFEEVLLLDADSQPLVDPNSLFDLPAYRMHGSQFWPDFVGSGGECAPSGEIYDAFGLSHPWNGHGNEGWLATESGQFLFDRLRHADVLEWIFFLNVHSAVTYDLMWGDKDTVELAFALANKPKDFQRMPFWSRAALTGKQWDDRWHYLGQVQNNKEGEPLFLHRSMSAKFLPDQDLDENYKVTFITSPVGKESFTRYHYMKAEDRGIIRVLDSNHGQTTLNCSDLDAKTVAILQRRNPDSLPGCEGAQPNVSGPITLIPVESYDEGITDAIDFSYAAFRMLRTFLQERSR